MKNNSGFTIGNLTIYIIAMLIVIGLVASITSFFYTNISNIDDSSKNSAEITKFNMYFLEDVKKVNNSVMKISENKKAITFSSGNTYTFQDNSIYFNNIRICENVKNTQFSTSTVGEKTVISVLITIGDKLEYTTTKQYVLSE